MSSRTPHILRAIVGTAGHVDHGKTELVQRLIVAVEQARVFWPAGWDVLTNELRRFEYAISPSGAITYSAPAGFHDDCVIALALANALRRDYAPPPLMPIPIQHLRAHARAAARALP